MKRRVLTRARQNHIISGALNRSSTTSEKKQNHTASGWLASTSRDQPSLFQHPLAPTSKQDAKPEEAGSYPFRLAFCVFIRSIVLNISLASILIASRFLLTNIASTQESCKAEKKQNHILSDWPSMLPSGASFSTSRLHQLLIASLFLFSKILDPQESCEAEKKQNHILSDWPRVLFVIQSIILHIMFASTISISKASLSLLFEYSAFLIGIIEQHQAGTQIHSQSHTKHHTALITLASSICTVVTKERPACVLLESARTTIETFPGNLAVLAKLSITPRTG